MAKEENRKPKKKSRRRAELIVSIFGIIITALLAVFIVTEARLPGLNFGAEKRQDSTTVQIQSTEAVTTSPNSTMLQIHYISVNQGDAVLINCGGHAMLIDAGSVESGAEVAAYLHKQNITQLDYIIGTSTDPMHIGGLNSIIGQFSVTAVLMPDISSQTDEIYTSITQALTDSGLVSRMPSAGTDYSLGEAIFSIIAPRQLYETDDDNSIGLLLAYGDKRFMFTGDAQMESEADIMASGAELHSDVYMVADHGSDTSNSAEFLDVVKPRFAVISAGAGNEEGYPKTEVMGRLKDAGIQIFRTDVQGTISLNTDGKNIIWSVDPCDNFGSGSEIPATTGAQKEETAENTPNAQNNGADSGDQTLIAEESAEVSEENTTAEETKAPETSAAKETKKTTKATKTTKAAKATKAATTQALSESAPETDSTEAMQSTGKVQAQPQTVEPPNMNTQATQSTTAGPGNAIKGPGIPKTE